MSVPGTFRCFQVEEDDINGGYRVVFSIVCYNNAFGEDAYPAVLKHFSLSGSTKFVVLLKDENKNYFEGLEYEDALDIADRYDNKYASIIVDCEDSGNWDDFPEELEFDFEDVVYWK